MGYLSSGGRKRNEIWQKCSLWDEDDAWTLNTRIAQRKCTISHLAMKNNHCNITQCCNNTYQRTQRTGKQTNACASDLGDASHVICIVLSEMWSGDVLCYQRWFAVDPPTGQLTVNGNLTRDPITVWQSIVIAVDDSTLQTATGMSVTSFMFSVTSLSLALSSVLQLMTQHRGLLLVCLSLPLCSLSLVSHWL